MFTFDGAHSDLCYFGRLTTGGTEFYEQSLPSSLVSSSASLSLFCSSSEALQEVNCWQINFTHFLHIVPFDLETRPLVTCLRGNDAPLMTPKQFILRLPLLWTRCCYYDFELIVLFLRLLNCSHNSSRFKKRFLR